nr:ribonuclease H-like domain-containing protein [Tanacetum cinerariifolium]
NLPYVASKASSVPAGSRNSSASISAGRSIPDASRNRPASIHAGRHIPVGRFNKPAHFPAGRSVPTGWTNHAARPFFRLTNLYFNVSWPGIYDHMSMNEGKWGSAAHPHVNKDIGIVDSGYSRSMTGNKEKLDDFVQVKGGTVTFGGGDGKITGKGTIRTSKLNFENVYYVEETINKLAKNGLVEGLPLKLFTNEHNCVACNKGKQHKASYKAISAVRTISDPLKLLYMDLFGPTSIRNDSLKEKKVRKEDDAGAVSISMMAKTIKESMTVFWDFLYTSKDTTNLFLTIILQGSKAHLQDLADSELAERWIRITGSLTLSV